MQMMTRFSFSKYKVSPKLKSKIVNTLIVTHQRAASQHLVNNLLLHIFFESPKTMKKEREKENQKEKHIPPPMNQADMTTNHKPLSKH